VLGLLGHKVTLFEARKEVRRGHALGNSRLSASQIYFEKEIERILRLPIDVRAGVKVGQDISFEELDRKN
jgi:NADPH-dependent glutamate synthase beta subunit-like oxidoreductase